jgi:hypothetical protein
MVFNVVTFEGKATPFGGSYVWRKRRVVDLHLRMNGASLNAAAAAAVVLQQPGCKCVRAVVQARVCCQRGSCVQASRWLLV